MGIIGAVGGALSGSITTAAGGSEFTGNIEERIIVKGSADRIAHIDLEGIIMNSSDGSGMSMVERFQLQMKKALADQHVKAIVVRIDSPGGGVTASDLLHRTMQKANAVKPVIAYMDTVAASGGYYMACGARKILAHETTITGSIGVIMQSPNYRELLDKVGLRMDVYKSGKFKDILSGSREPTEEERAYIQAMVRQTYERFLEVVSASRNKSMDELRDSEVADGRFYSGKDAKAKGMVDETGFIDDAYAEAMKAAGITGATIVRYRPTPNLFAMLGLLGQAKVEHGNQVQLDISSRLLPHLEPGVAYYLHLPASTAP